MNILDLSENEIKKRIYTDDLLKDQKAAVYCQNYFRSTESRTNEIADGIVLPLKMYLNERGESVFKGGIVHRDGTFFSPSAHIHKLDTAIGSLTEGYVVDEKDVSFNDGTVIYGGILFDHFGHFLTESVSRLWYICEHTAENIRIAFLPLKNQKPSPQIYEFFELLGIKREQIILIDRPTRFPKIVVPDTTSVFCGYYTDKFMMPYRTVSERVEPKNEEKIYLSRRKFKGGITIYGEDRLEDAFKKNGFKVLYPERLSLKEQIAYVKGAREIACVMGTAAHLCLFAKEHTKMIVLERTEHINEEQILIQQAARSDWYTISANMNYLPVDNEFSPILMGITDSLAAFFKDGGYNFDSKTVNRIADKYVRRFGQMWFSRYSALKYNNRISAALPAYSERIRLYCQTAFLSLRQRLFMKRTEGEYRVWSVLGFSFKTKRNKNISISVRDIPVYIISFNRLSYLESLVNWLEKAGCRNIHIVDNASTYPPLLDYLSKTPHTVHRMEKNYGHTVLFNAPEFKDVVDNQYFVLSDPDILPVEECPADFMQFLSGILERYPNVTKAGFGLKLDDLPDHYALKETVIKWESAFYEKAIKGTEPALYKAPIDTTFALYRPRKEWKKDFGEAIRTGFPYQARHLPWYKDLNALTEEDRFYNALDTGSGNWNGTKVADRFQMTEKSYIKLFGFLPVLKIKRKKNKKTFLLFCFLPILRIKEDKQSFFLKHQIEEVFVLPLFYKGINGAEAHSRHTGDLRFPDAKL